MCNVTLLVFNNAFQSPCESFPCQHGGTCRPLYEENDYACDCRDGFIGKRCEKGEWLSTQPINSEVCHWFNYNGKGDLGRAA